MLSDQVTPGLKHPGLAKINKTVHSAGNSPIVWSTQTSPGSGSLLLGVKMLIIFILSSSHSIYINVLLYNWIYITVAQIC